MTEVGPPTYTEFLTETYNETFTELYDLGNGGATIDVNIDPSPYGTIVRTFRQQVDELFLPYYGNSSHFWTATNTLFTVFFGVNDVIIENNKDNASDYTTALANSYGELVEDVRQIRPCCASTMSLANFVNLAIDLQYRRSQLSLSQRAAYQSHSGQRSPIGP